jgi:hypothetical protein
MRAAQARAQQRTAAEPFGIKCARNREVFEAEKPFTISAFIGLGSAWKASFVVIATFSPSLRCW